ncbi:molecular chaperone DnaJ [Candidatus Peribacteria bacterium]|nr:molecular chaperone DnaJ [Candidatus Peribacteria bacterium]
MDYYQILGVSKDSSQADIKKAYRKLSKEWHPDKHKGDKKAEDKYKQINRAYECLSNSGKKQAYDQFGSEDGPQFGGGGGGNPFGGGFQGGGFGDIFETFFGGGRGGGGTRQSDMQGRDVEARINISLEDAYSGDKKGIRMKKHVQCESCSGSGAKKGSSKKNCHECNGTGQVTRTVQSFFGAISQSMMCEVCRGAGKVPESPCGKCSGEGRVVDVEEIIVDIPTGINDGQTLRVPGKGEVGRQGASSGDLYVRISVSPDKRFIREGDDLRVEKIVSVADAVLGKEEDIETFSGKVTVKIPPGTQPGQILRMKGKGMPILNTSRFGDLFVIISIEVPKKINRKERGMWESLRKS